MIYLNINFDDETLKKPVELLQSKLDFKISDSGIVVNIKKAERLNVNFDGEVGNISYITKASFFRMLTMFLKNYKEKNKFDYSEKIEIKTCGVMLDLSRNGVMTKEALGEYFSYMAMMGLNSAMLYIESGYKLDGYPYFGYMQGAYTKEELRAIDDMADMFGIEVYPAIQTLTHMEKYLRFSAAAPVRDTVRVMMTEVEETYKLIEQMFTQLLTCFRSNKIHMGMDEGWNLGRGDYFLQYYTNRQFDGKMPRELFVNHVKRVTEIALRCGVEPSMWGSTIRAYDVQDELKDFKPFEKVSIPCGSYEGQGTEDDFKKIFSKYNKLKGHKGFVGGIQTWYGFAPENNFTLGNVKTFLPYCKKYGFDEVHGTIWMNDGTECDFFLSLLGAQAYAEHMYHAEVSDQQIKEMFEFTTGTSYDAFMDMSYFHNKNMKDNELIENDGMHFFGKKLLWSDPMLGLFDYHLYQSPMSGHYAKMREKFQAYKDKGDTFSTRYEFFELLFDVLSSKCYIAENLKKAYMENDYAFLTKAAKELFPALKEKVEALRKYHRKLWLEVCKPFGYEVLDIRYGGLVVRCESSIDRLTSYLEGRLHTIEELDEERLPKGVIYSAMYFGQSSACNPTTGCI